MVPGRNECSRLLLLAARGDMAAFAQLYVRMAPALRRTGLAHGCSEEAVDDLVQEVFTRAWEHRGSFQAGSTAETYFYAIARNVVREDRRRWRKWSSHAGEMSILAAGRQGHFENSEKLLRVDDLVKRVEEARRGLPSSQRVAFELVYVVGLSMGEAAEAAGCSYDELRGRLDRARQNLRRLLNGPP